MGKNEQLELLKRVTKTNPDYRNLLLRYMKYHFTEPRSQYFQIQIRFQYIADSVLLEWYSKLPSAIRHMV